MLEIRNQELAHQHTMRTSSCYPWMAEHGGPQDEPNSSDEPNQVDVDGVNDLLSRRIDEFLPCHYFDYVAGTSTGGLTSLMLGRLRMTVDEAIDQYTYFGNRVFGKPRSAWIRAPALFKPAKYSSKKARRAIKHVIAEGLQTESSERGPLSQFRFEARNEPLKTREDRTRTYVAHHKHTHLHYLTMPTKYDHLHLNEGWCHVSKVRVAELRQLL